MDLCLMNDRILVEVIERKLSKGGIVLPDIVTAKQTITMIEATVVKTGPGKYVPETGKRVAMSVKVGDTIFTYRHLVGEMEIEDKKYGMLNEDSCIAYVRN